MVTAARVFGDQVARLRRCSSPSSPFTCSPGSPRWSPGRSPRCRQGLPARIRWGRCYYRVISVVFVTATVLAVMRWRQDDDLFIIGARRRPPRPSASSPAPRPPRRQGDIVGMGTVDVAMLTASMLLQRPAPAAGGPPAGPGVLAASLGHRRPGHSPRGDARPAGRIGAPGPPGAGGSSWPQSRMIGLVSSSSSGRSPPGSGACCCPGPAAPPGQGFPQPRGRWARPPADPRPPG